MSKIYLAVSSGTTTTLLLLLLMSAAVEAVVTVAALVAMEVALPKIRRCCEIHIKNNFFQDIDILAGRTIGATYAINYRWYID